MSTNYAGQPLPLFWDRKVSSLKKLLLYLTEFGSLPLPFRSTQQRKPTPSVSPTDVSESQKVKRLGFPFPSLLPLLLGLFPKL